MTCLLLLGASKLLERKDSISKYYSFFSQKEDFDVLFFGSSHMLNGVYPMELWNKYGIVSYNFGGHSNTIPTSYWVMKNALDYTNPKVVVLDCFIVGDYKESDQNAHLHISFDAFPLSQTKIMAIEDLSDDPIRDADIKSGISSVTSSCTKEELIWDYSLYHSRWNELEFLDFNYDENLDKGAERRIAVSSVEKAEFDDLSEIPAVDENRIPVQYLMDFISECKKSNIEVVLIYLPYGDWGEEIRVNAAQIGQIAKEYNVEYINFLDENILDTNVDFYNSGHLNPSGARKVSTYLGKLLCEKYDIADHKNDDEYYEWHNDYEEYRSNCDWTLKEENDLSNYLMLLYDYDVDYTIEVLDETLLTNNMFSSLLSNLSYDVIQPLIAPVQNDDLDASVRISVSRDGEIIDKVTFACDNHSDDESLTTIYAVRK